MASGSRIPSLPRNLGPRGPQLAREMIRVIHISKLQSAYRLRFGPDGQSLEWLTMDDEGEVILSMEPDVTPLMRLQNMLLAPSFRSSNYRVARGDAEARRSDGAHAMQLPVPAPASLRHARCA